MDPRVLDTWDGVPRRQPARIGPGEFDLRELVAGLTDPAVVGGIRLAEPAAGVNGKIPAGVVWQCSLRNTAVDRVLSDDEWRGIARDVLHRTGIAPRGDSGACRWVVVRHADDHVHVHVEAVLVREDTGRRFFPRNDYLRARETCLAAEQKYGLVQTAPVDRTAVPGTSRAELEKAVRRQVGEASRVWLRRVVRVAVVGARDPEAFFAGLREAGVRVRLRHDDCGGRLVGYAVARPGDAARGGEPVWYGGCGLAGDLSLPQLTRRWASAPGPSEPILPEPGERAEVGRAQREAALADATSATQAAAASLAAGEGDEGGIAHAAGDLLTALAAVTPESGMRDRLALVAEGYDRAARTPGVGQPLGWGAHARALRTAAWQLASVRVLSGRGSDAAGAAMLAAALAVLVVEVAAYHAARARHVQAAAAWCAHDELVASRSGDTRPGRAEGSARFSTQRGARRDPDRAAERLTHQSGAAPGRQDPPPVPGPDETRPSGRTR